MCCQSVRRARTNSRKSRRRAPSGFIPCAPLIPRTSNCQESAQTQTLAHTVVQRFFCTSTCIPCTLARITSHFLSATPRPCPSPLPSPPFFGFPGGLLSVSVNPNPSFANALAYRSDKIYHRGGGNSVALSWLKLYQVVISLAIHFPVQLST
jgi:hypothetical protein